MTTGYANPYVVVAGAEPSVRAQFIRQTYLHLAGAIAAFIAIESMLLTLPGIEALILKMTGGMGWLLVIGAFMIVSYITDKWARSDSSKAMQYVGLGLFTIAEAIIFLPLIYIALNYMPDGSGLVAKAGLITGLMVAGITATAFITKKDFSFLGGILTIGGFVALGIIVASIIFGFGLGLIFAGAMAIFASVSILHSTSKIIHHYPPGKHVAAALQLFAGIALLFWYILQILISLSGRD
jgi:FtsH-binding integral membrane protein